MSRSICTISFSLFMIVLAVSAPLASQSAAISLPQWTLTVDNRTIPVSPVLWDRSVSKGGAGQPYEGIAEYRTSFVIPQKLQNEQLAFFVSSIDDADRTFFNGTFIGETGRFPSADGSGSRSGVREPRLYVIPQSALRDGENEIRIEVFNFAGAGGLNGYAPPVIAPYRTLAKKAGQQLLCSDGIRILILAIQAAILVALCALMYIYGTRHSFRYALRKTMAAFNLPGFIRRTSRRKAEFKGEVVFRGLIAVITTLCFSLFLFSELSFKYQICGSEAFWFKAPALALYIGFLSIITLYHADIFGTALPAPPDAVIRMPRRALSIIIHPSVLSLFLVYMLVLPVRLSWSTFVIAGSAIMFSVLTVMFIYIIIRLIKAGLSTKNRRYSALLLREGIVRALFAGGFICGFAVFHNAAPLINAQGSIIVTTFSFIYMIFSLIFFFRHRTTIQETDGARELDSILHDRFDLTPSEVKIASLIAHGYPRDEICSRNGITPATLKIHLKSIYGKTVDTGTLTKESRSGKLQRLTIFLHDLERGNDI